MAVDPLDEKLSVPEVLRLIEQADAEDEEWSELVKRARGRLTVAFDNGEVDARTAAQIILADARLREKAKPAGDQDPLSEMREAAASVFGIKRGASTKADGVRARATKRR